MTRRQLLFSTLFAARGSAASKEIAKSEVFKADTGGYAIYRISRVIDIQPDEARQRSVQTEMGRIIGTEEFKSYLASLRANANVEINKALLEKKAN